MKNENLEKYTELIEKRDKLVKETQKLEHEAFTILRKALENASNEGKNLE